MSASMWSRIGLLIFFTCASYKPRVTVWDFLATPGGVELEHALITLIVAVAAWFSYMAHRQSSNNAKALNSHLEQHVLEAVEKNGNDK